MSHKDAKGRSKKIRSDMFSKKKISPTKNSSTKKFKRRSTNDDIMNNFLDLDDNSSPPMERLPNEEANWQHEAEELTLPERRFFQRKNGINFNMAEVTSVGKSDGESSNPLLLGY